MKGSRGEVRLLLEEGADVNTVGEKHSEEKNFRKKQLMKNRVSSLQKYRRSGYMIKKISHCLFEEQNQQHH